MANVLQEIRQEEKGTGEEQVGEEPTDFGIQPGGVWKLERSLARRPPSLCLPAFATTFNDDSCLLYRPTTQAVRDFLQSKTISLSLDHPTLQRSNPLTLRSWLAALSLFSNLAARAPRSPTALQQS